MKTLDEFNENRRNELFAQNEPCLNGIVCECGEGLLDSAPLVILTTDPPQKAVHCSVCDFRGYRVA